ncbi:MAG TPA: hypothetical protein VGG81_02195 [Edaphobacter sp.]|jgi:hypothetical protein
MSKHPKSGSGKPHPNPNNDGGDDNKRKISGEIHVRGGIETNVPASLIEQYKTARNEDKSRDNWRFLVEILTLGAVIIYAGLTAWQGWMTRKLVDTGRLSTRPYVGVDSIGVSFQSHKPNGERFLVPNPDDTTDAIGWSPAIKNFGTVPGYNEIGYQRVFINGAESNWYVKIPDEPGTIFPGQTLSLIGHTSPKEWPGIRDGRDTLTVDVHVEYDGPDKEHYKYCDRLQYSKNTYRFLNLGPICAK